ncbi:MAG TPA: gamma-glutamylcyclotransferase, partial [Pseudonocardiaceae bacterium]
GARPATLAAWPGVVEEHAVLMVTREQLRVLDVCEGRGERYALAALRTGRVELDDGAVARDVLTYVTHAPIRAPLHTARGMVRCALVGQDEALTLAGTPGRHGLDTCEVPPADVSG